MKRAADPWDGNPFPGLRPFREDEEHLFFGRERQVDAMVDRLAATRFLAVVGGSGCGKSSLVNCGLRPALRQGLMARAGTRWRMAQFRPGSDPIGSLARALAEDGLLCPAQSAALSLADMVETSLRMSKLGIIDVYEQAALPAGTNLLVVVDQFEELFRFRRSAAAGAIDPRRVGEDAVAFVNLLLEAREQAACPVYIVITMRSDFLGDCTRFPGLAEAINAGQYLVPRMTRDERRAAIGRPVSVGRARMSPALLTRLVNDVGDDPDQLSILQHALQRTWARWEQDENRAGPLELRHYGAIGTMSQALDQHAEEAFAELPTPHERRICEKVFKALTDKATDARGIRRPATLAVLCTLSGATAAEVAEVMSPFREPGRSFLMPPVAEPCHADTVIDISHESLMRVWGRLADWVNEEAASAIRYRRLAESATQHALGQAGLLRDPELQLCLDWKVAVNPNAAWASLYGGGFDGAMHYLNESEAERARERSLIEERQRRELEQAQLLAEERARSASRMRIGMACTAALAAVSVLAALWALDQRTVAHQMRDISLARQLAALATLQGSENRSDLEPAALLAIEAMSRLPGLESDLALRGATRPLAHQTQLLRHGSPVKTAAYAPDGRAAATGSQDGSVRLFDPASGRELWRHATSAAVRVLVFSPDGRNLAAVAADGHLQVIDAASGATRWEGPRDLSVDSASFAADSRTVITGGKDKSMRVFDSAGGTERWRVDHDSAVVSAVDGGEGRVVTASGTRARLLDPLTHRDLWSDRVQHGQFPGTMSSLGTVTSAVVSPDHRMVLTSKRFEFGESGWQLFELATGKLIALGKETGFMAFSPDSRRILVGGTVFEAREDKEVVSRVASGAAAFSPDGTLLAIGTDVLGVYEVATGFERIRLAHQGPVNAVAFSPDGQHVLSASDDGTARILETADGTTSSVAIGLGGRLDLAMFSADGRRMMLSGLIVTMFVGTMDEWARIADTDTGKPVLELTPVGATLMELDASGRRVAVVSDVYGTIKLQVLDASGTPAMSRVAPVSSVAISADGRHVAAGDDSGVSMLDASTGAALFRLPHDRPVTTLAFSADGRSLVTRTDDATRVFDTASHAQLRRLVGADRFLAISADGSRVTLADGRAARVVEVSSGRVQSRFDLHDSAAPPTLSEDGHWQAVILGGVAHVFETGSGKEMARVSVRGAIRVARLLDQGRVLELATETAGELRISHHRLWPQDMIDFACTRLTRNLTRAEWGQFVGSDTPYRRTCLNLP